jgi:hypothetical protein
MVSTNDTVQRSWLTQLRIPIRTPLVHQSAPCHTNSSSCYSAVRLCAHASMISAQTAQHSTNFFGFVGTHLHFTDGAVHSPVLYRYNFCCNRSGLPLNICTSQPNDIHVHYFLHKQTPRRYTCVLPMLHILNARRIPCCYSIIYFYILRINTAFFNV